MANPNQTTSKTDNCKGCQRDIRLSDEQIQRMLDKITPDKFAVTSEQVYAARIAACMSCEALIEGHTCRYCGCIVHIRAKLADQDCPNPSGSCWKVS